MIFVFDVAQIGISPSENRRLGTWNAKANQAYVKSLFLACYESASICKYLAFFFVFFSSLLFSQAQSEIKTIVLRVQQ